MVSFCSGDKSLVKSWFRLVSLDQTVKMSKIKRKVSPVIWVDYMSAIALASNSVLHARTKHIELDIHFVRDKVLADELDLRHVPSFDQVADIFTKPLSQQSFVKPRARLGIASLASLGLRGRVEEQDKTGVGPTQAYSDAKAVNEPTASFLDHTCTWRDVAIKWMMKKKGLQS